MLLLQISDCLRAHSGPGFEDLARQAVLEWALSPEMSGDICVAASDALTRLPTDETSPAHRAFRTHLEHAARSLPTPTRRGGRQGRLNRLRQAA